MTISITSKLQGVTTIESRSADTSSEVLNIPKSTVLVPATFSLREYNLPSVVTPQNEETPMEVVNYFPPQPVLTVQSNTIQNQDIQSSPEDGVSDTSIQPSNKKIKKSSSNGMRLNKFVRRLHDMLQSEQNSGIVEWRRGLLVLHSTNAFAKNILPKYFNTKNFKTFRRQLNYYGFVHVRSFSTTGSTTTALWVNRDLARNGTAHVSSVLMLKRVEPCESTKTAEGRRVRKELAVSTVEDDIGVSAKSLQMEQIRSLALRADNGDLGGEISRQIPFMVDCRSISRACEADNALAANLLLMLSKSESVRC